MFCTAETRRQYRALEPAGFVERSSDEVDVAITHRLTRGGTDKAKERARVRRRYYVVALAVELTSPNRRSRFWYSRTASKISGLRKSGNSVGVTYISL